MEHLKFMKGFGLTLIVLGLIVGIGNAIFVQSTENTGTIYKLGLVSGVAIGFALCGGILRLYSASNE
jgi:hypothetical protein